MLHAGHQAETIADGERFRTDDRALRSVESSGVPYVGHHPLARLIAPAPLGATRDFRRIEMYELSVCSIGTSL